MGIGSQDDHTPRLGPRPPGKSVGPPVMSPEIGPGCSQKPTLAADSACAGLSARLRGATVGTGPPRNRLRGGGRDQREQPFRATGCAGSENSEADVRARLHTVRRAHEPG